MNAPKRYVEHTDNPDHPAQAHIGTFNVAVGAIILDESNQILLTQRAHDNPAHPGAWELLFGRVNQGETFETALHREAMEELGIQIYPHSIIATMRFTRTEEEPEHIGIVFLAHILPDQTITPDPTEIAGHKWTSLEEALETAADYTRPYIEFTIAQLQG